MAQVQKQLRPQIHAVSEKVPPPAPHRFWPEVLVTVKRHQKETLGPDWKGPYTVILTILTAVKEDGVPT